jgi:hypothetical protein
VPIARALPAAAPSVTPAALPEVPPAAPGVEGRKAFDDLSAFYRGGNEVPFDRAIADLAAPDSAARQAAGAYLLSLFRQSLADESNGRAPWHGTPYWGGGAESQARQLRNDLAKEFGTEAVGRDAVPAIEWLLGSEPVPSIQSSGLQALSRLDDVACTPLLLKVLQPPHTNTDVVLLALHEVVRRRLGGFQDPIVQSCRDPRPSVRAGARTAADSLGVRPLPEPDPSLLLTADLVGDLNAIARMVIVPIPRSARMAMVHARDHLSLPDTIVTHSYPAWVLGQRGGSYYTLDMFGVERREPRRQTTVGQWSLVKEAARLRQARGENSLDELSAGGALTSQFEARSLSVPEALVAAWSLERGDRNTAAALILPRLDALDDTRHLRPIVRDLLGTTYYKEMLKKFSYDRDYARTIVYADHLSKPVFEGFQYHAIARELGEQLLQRGDDFVSLALPDSAAWRALQGRLSRREQVDYLASRLRLLNAFQEGQPGGVAFFIEQYAEPWRRTGPWDERSNSSRRLINPLLELEQLRLDVTEIPMLFSHLADSDFTPTFEFWRDFHPMWDLYRVGTLVEELINGIAQRPLVHSDEVRALGPGGRQVYFARIEAWCQAHAGMAPAELDLDVLTSTTSANEFEMAARKRVEAKDARAVAPILSRMDEFPQWKAELIEYLYRIDSPAAVPKARECVAETLKTYNGPMAAWLMDADRSRQSHFYAALILLRHGDRDHLEGLGTVDAVLASDRDGYYQRIAKSELDSIPAEKLFQARCGMLGNDGPELRTSISDVRLRRFILMRCPNAYEFLLRALDSEAPRGTLQYVDSTTHRQVRRSLVEGDDAAIVVGSWRRGIGFSLAPPDEERRHRRAELKAWLVEQFRKIRAGEESEIR